MRSTGKLLVLAGLALFVITGFCGEFTPDQRRMPLPYPFARGALTKLNLAAQKITVNTDNGDRDFILTPKTYIFRDKQKISADQLKVGELIKLNFLTNETGQAFVRRIKVAPIEPGTNAPAPPVKP